LFLIFHLMSKEILTKNAQQTIRERSLQQRQKQRMLPIMILIALGLILLGAAWYFVAYFWSAQASIEYTPNDISYNQPIKAVHEMGGSRLDSVSFLPKDGPQPRIELSEDFHNFGSVGSSDVVDHAFVIANRGEAPLTISRAYTTCGCTTAEFSASVIPPGKVSIVTMVYDAGFHDARGQTVRRGIIIENNDPRNPQVEVWAQATVRNIP
jgi:hypothetical protein